MSPVVPRGNSGKHSDELRRLRRRVEELEQAAEEHCRAEKALKESEALFRRLVENAPVAIGIAVQGKLVFVNAATVRLSGASSPKDLLGRMVFDLFPSSRKPLAGRRYLNIQREGGRLPLIEHGMVRRDGATVVLETTAIPFTYFGRPAHLIFGHDISARKEAQKALEKPHERLEELIRERTEELEVANGRLRRAIEEHLKIEQSLRESEATLRKSEARYRAIVEDQTELICRYTPDTVLTFLNGACRRFFGTSGADFLGKSFLDFLCAEDREQARSHLSSLLSGATRQVSAVYRVPRPGGELRWQEWSTRAIHDEHGRVVELQGVGRDFTDLKQTQDTLLKRETELNEKTRHLEAVNSALKVLLKRREDDKQELRESLMLNIRELILPYIEKIKESGLSTEQATYLSIIESHLTEIVSPFVRELSSQFMNFTPTEIRVAIMIREGKRTKEIAETLNLSESAINFHRHNIRSKLGLTKKRSNLRSYLQTFR